MVVKSWCVIGGDGGRGDCAKNPGPSRGLNFRGCAELESLNRIVHTEEDILGRDVGGFHHLAGPCRESGLGPVLVIGRRTTQRRNPGPDRRVQSVSVSSFRLARSEP